MKSGAKIQSWYQKGFSKISFGIQPTLSWNPQTNEYGSTARRQADVYAFCVLAHKDQTTINPLDLDQWEFYLLPTKVLNQSVGTQKTITLSRVIELGAAKVPFDGICETVREMVG